MKMISVAEDGFFFVINVHNTYTFIRLSMYFIAKMALLKTADILLSAMTEYREI